MPSTFFDDVKWTLNNLSLCLANLSVKEYTCPISIIGEGTIGQHTRHSLEFFDSLLTAYEIGLLNYDNRKRNRILESNIDFTQETISLISCNLQKPDKSLTLVSNEWMSHYSIRTNYHRELYYCMEHCIHHQAIIKAGLLSLGVEIKVKDFGMAKATLMYSAGQPPTY